MKELPALWSSTSIFQREQHAFLALWMNRYANGGFDVSYDANIVRSQICCNEWLSFAMTLLASPDPVTRKHAHAALQSLRGNMLTIPSRPSSVSSQQLSVSSQQIPLDRKLSGPKSRSKKLNASNALMYSHHLSSIGLDRAEESDVIDTLKKAKLPLHILLRPGIELLDIRKVLSKLSTGTRLAVMDGLRDLRIRYDKARTVVHDKSLGIKQKAMELPDIKTIVSRSGDGQLDGNPVCFISYCWAQKSKAKALKETLEEHGIKCWMDEQQIEGGSMLF